MPKWFLSAILLCLSCLSAPAADVDQERAALKAVLALDQATNPDTEAIASALKKIISDPSIDSLSESERHAAYLLYASALFDSKDYSAARPYAERASASPLADNDDWDLRLRTDFYLHDYIDAARPITEIAQQWPEKLADYYDHSFFTVVSAVQDDPKSAETALSLLQALHAAKWKPENPFDTADFLWLSLAARLLDQGLTDGAKIVAADIHTPYALVEMKADNRFDMIVRSNPDNFDIKRAFDDVIAQIRAESEKAPDKLEGINVLANLLRAENRSQEALSVVDQALAHWKSKPDFFSDAGEKLNWIIDTRANVLFDLGRNSEAFAAMTDAASHDEDGKKNVSQAINLADAYNTFGRPKDALTAVSALDFKSGSTYGSMALEAARACAYFQLGDVANLARSVDYLKVHRTDGTGAYMSALLCLGKVDDVAHEMIARLDDIEGRVQMLIDLQDDLSNPILSEQEKASRATWLSARNRPDVTAAIAKVGKVNSIPVRYISF
ncbi:MAG: hypothetical protein WDM89_11080 [Rhizomicrobium sp.]